MVEKLFVVLFPDLFHRNGKHIALFRIGAAGGHRLSLSLSCVGKGLHDTKSHCRGKGRQMSLSATTMVKGHISWWRRLCIYKQVATKRGTRTGTTWRSRGLGAPAATS